MDDMSWDADDDYAREDQGTSANDWESTFGDEEVHDGFHDPFADELDGDDADAWMKANDALLAEDEEAFRADNKKNYEEGYGKASVKALKEGQLSHATPQVRKAVLDLRAGTLDGSAAGKDEMDMAFAREELNTALDGQLPSLNINVKPHELPSKVHQVDASEYANYVVGETKTVKYDHRYVMKPSSQTVNLALGYATKTEDYLQRGAGGSLPGNTLSADDPGLSVHDSNRRFNKQKQLDDDMAKAIGIIHNMAGLYIHPATQGNPELYETRLQAVKTALTKRALDGQVYEDSEAAVPYPNEVGVFTKGDVGVAGLKPTKSYGGTSPFNRLTWGINKDRFEEGSKAFFKHMPNLRGSLFDYDKEQADPKQHQKDQLAQLSEDYSFAIKTLRAQMPTTQDENWGNQSRHPGQVVANDLDGEGPPPNTWEEAQNLDLELSGEDATSQGISAAAAGLMGSSQVGLSMHGSVESRTKGLSGFAKMDAAGAYYRTRAGKLSANQRLTPHDGSKDAEWQYDEESGSDTYVVGTRGQGSSKATMHGEVAESEYSIYHGARMSGLSVEEAFDMAKTGATEKELISERDDPYPESGSDQDKYAWEIRNSSDPEQGGKEWLRLRKGKVTASQMLLMKERKGVEKLASELAASKLDPDGSKGYHDKFYGNSYTVDGNRFEDTVKDRFLKTVGKNFNVEEAFFKTHKENSRIGASPDGMLFDKETGAGAGLLELKYLTPGAMDEAVKKYTPQMQLQMAVTGETQTNFFALDKYTDDYVHAVIQADPELQAELMAEAEEVLNLTQGIKNLGDVQIMRNAIKQKPAKKAKGAVSGEKFVPVSKTADVIEPWKPMTQLDLHKKAIEATAGTGVEQAGDVMTNMFKIMKDDKAKAKEALLGRAGGGGGGGDNGADDLAEANKKASDSVDTLGDKMDQMGDAFMEGTSKLSVFTAAMVDAASMLLEGSKSGMDEVRFAAQTGMGVDEARGLRFALQDAGLSDSMASSVMSQGGDLQDKFNSEVGAAKAFTKMQYAQGVSNLDAVRDLKMPTLEQSRQMNPQEWVAMVQSMMEGKSDEEKTAIGKIFNMQELAASDATGKELGAAKMSVDEKALRDTYEGVTKVEQDIQRTKEGLSTQDHSGRNSGAAARALKETTKYASTNNAVVQGLVAAGGAGYTAGGFLFDKQSPEVEQAGNNMFEAGANFLGFGREHDNFMPDGKIDNTYIPKTKEEAQRILNSNVKVDVHVDPDMVRTETDNNGVLAIDQETNVAP